MDGVIGISSEAQRAIWKLNDRIAELEAQLAEQKEWVKELADLNVKNEARLAVVRDIAKSVIFDSHSEVVDNMCKIRSALSYPVSLENGDTPVKRKDGE